MFSIVKLTFNIILTFLINASLLSLEAASIAAVTSSVPATIQLFASFGYADEINRFISSPIATITFNANQDKIYVGRTPCVTIPVTI